MWAFFGEFTDDSDVAGAELEGGSDCIGASSTRIAGGGERSDGLDLYSRLSVRGRCELKCEDDDTFELIEGRAVALLSSASSVISCKRSCKR